MATNTKELLTCVTELFLDCVARIMCAPTLCSRPKTHSSLALGFSRMSPDAISSLLLSKRMSDLSSHPTDFTCSVHPKPDSMMGIMI